ncbi:DedA family protein [Motilibacter deserti]|uniref:DedA family protein n=1 Tax=Motilibacter deserti TaxID=2714956 RepID=A0ABX0GXB4_9ACTN|nr:DedA family protein [Motilibacter deserti]
MESFAPDLGGLGAAAVYLIVFGFVFVESGLLIGFLLPGDSLLFGAGLVSGAEDSGVSMPLLAIGVAVAAVTGDAVGYATGYRLGRPWLDRRVAKGRLDARHLERAERFYARYGALAVIIARWIPWVRTFTPILAGASRMPYPRFLAANVVGALTWGSGLVVLGYVAASVPWVRDAAIAVGAFFVVASLLVAVVAAVRARRANRGKPRQGE